MKRTDGVTIALLQAVLGRVRSVDRRRWRPVRRAAGKDDQRVRSPQGSVTGGQGGPRAYSYQILDSVSSSYVGQVAIGLADSADVTVCRDSGRISAIRAIKVNDTA